MNIWKYIKFLKIHILLLSILYSGVTVTATKTGRNITGYFNESNDITITITLDGDQANGGSNDMSGRRIAVHAGFSTQEDNITISRSMEAIGYSISSTGADNTHTYTITNNNLVTRHGSTPTDKYFDFNIRFTDGTTDGYVDTDGDGAGADDIFAVDFNCDNSNSCSQEVLQYERDSPWVDMRMWRAAGWSSYNFDDETFSTQRVRIDPDETLSNHSGAYNNYIYFQNNSDIYRYKIGTVAAQLNTDATIIDLTSNVEKENDDGSWSAFSGVLFEDGVVYDIYGTIYDIAGNISSWSQNQYHDDRPFDGTTPTVVMNGTGETFGPFGPGNDPITGNAINDTDPYYFTTDEDVVIYFNWQHDPNNLEEMHGFANTDVKINGRSDHGVSLAEDGDNNVYTMTLTGMGSGSHINGDGNTIISLDAGVTSDVAGNDNTAASFTFRFDITSPTLAITATRVGGDAITQSSVHNFSENVKFTFTWTESNRWGANEFVVGDVTINGFAIADPSYWVEVNDATYTLTIPNADLTQTGTMLSVLVPTGSVADIGGLTGPAENTVFSFYFDRTTPGSTIGTEDGNNNHITVKGDADGYLGNSAFVANNTHHGGVNDDNAETYTVTFDWNGSVSGDESVPLDFDGGNITITGATEGVLVANNEVSTTDYDFYGLFVQNGDVSHQNVYYISSLNAGQSWDNQYTLASAQGNGAHMTFVQSENENNFIFQVCTFINADIWIGGSDADVEATWIWKDGVTDAEVGANAEPTFWNGGEPNNAADSEHSMQYYYNTKRWNDLPSSTELRTVLEVESSEVNKFTLPLTNLQEGDVTIRLTGLQDPAGNTLANAIYHTFTYDISDPVFLSDDSGVLDNARSSYVVAAHTKDQRPRITVKVTDNLSTAADEITMLITKGADFTVDADKIYMRANGSADAYVQSFTITHNTSTIIQIAGFDGNSDIDLIEGDYALRIKLTDRAGNFAEIADALTFTVDTTVPNVTITAAGIGTSNAVASGLEIPYGVNENVVMTFEWNDLLAVDAFTVAGGDITVSPNSITLGALSSRSQDVGLNTETYTLQLSNLPEKEDIIISVPKNNVPDNANNTATGTNRFNFSYDITRPVLSSISASGVSSSTSITNNGNYKGNNGVPEDIDVVFNWLNSGTNKDGFLLNGAVDGVDDFDEVNFITDDITILINGAPPSAAPAFIEGQPTTDNNYTLRIPSSNFVGIQGDIRISVDADEVQDLAGNLGPETEQIFLFNYDTIPPTPTISSPTVASSGPVNRTNGDINDNVTLNIDWNDDLIDLNGNGVDENDSFIADDVQIITEYIGATDPGGPYYVINTALNGNENTYSIVLSDLVDSTQYTIRISADQARDNAQNDGPIETVNYVFFFDTSPPQLSPFEVAGSVSGAITDGSYYRANNGVAETVTLDFIWNELIRNFSSAAVTITSNGDPIDGTLSDPILDNGNYRYTMTINAAEFVGNEGLIRFRIGQNNVIDDAGNTGPASSSDFRLTYDITPPDGREETVITSPTNVDYPHVEVKAIDAISSGSDVITAIAYVWMDDNGDDIIDDLELSQIRLSENDANNLQSSVLIHGTNAQDLYFGSADANSPILPEGDYKIVLTFTDQALNIETLRLTNFTIDRTAPVSINPVISSLTSIYRNPYTDSYYWNDDSSALTVTVNLPADSSVLGGEVQLKAKVGVSGLYQDLAPARSVAANNYSDDNTNGRWDEGEALLPLVINVSDNYASSDIGFEELQSNFDSIEIYISAIITDRASNTNCTDENGLVESQVDLLKFVNPIIVDQTNPSIGSLRSVAGVVNGLENDNNIYSVGKELFWNISTSSLDFKLIFPINDESLIDGDVLINARLGANIDQVGPLYRIIAGDTTIANGKNISIDSVITGDINGIIEFVDDFYSNDNGVLRFDVTITDAAGNQISWSDANNVKIDLTPPSISMITSTDDNGWYNINDTINVQVRSTDNLLISSETKITLETNTSTLGIADYISIDANPLRHNFRYIVLNNHTSANNTDVNSDTDGLIEVVSITPFVNKLDDPGGNENQWVVGITDEAGNYLPLNSANIDLVSLSITNNIPLANSINSIDGQKLIKVDAVAPQSFDLFTQIPFKANGGTSSSSRPREDGTLWETNDGIYWNSTHTSLNITVPLLNIYAGTDSAETDFSLANSNNEQGSIRLRATLQQDNINALNDTDFVYLGDPVNINFEQLAAEKQTITIQKSVLESLDGDGNLDASVIRINAEIYDIAGNLTLGDLSQPGEIKTIEVDYTSPDTSNIGSNIIVSASDINNQNSFAGFWNQYNTQMNIRVSIPSTNDASLINGRIDLLGRMSVNTTWDTLGAIGSNDYYIQSLDTSNGYIESIINNTIAIDNIGVEDDTIGVEEITGFEEGGVIEFCAVFYDQAGNPVRYSVSPSSTIVIDRISPTIQSISSTNNNLSYSVEDSLTIFATTSDPLLKDDAVTTENTFINLTSDSLSENEAKFLNHNLDTIFFSYIVQDGHSTEIDDNPEIDEAEYLNTDGDNAITLIGGNQFPYFFTDQAGNSLNIDVASATQLNTNKQIVIDTNKPSARFGYFETETNPSDTTDGIISINDSLLIIKAFFDDSIKVDSIPQIEIHYPTSEFVSIDPVIGNMERTNAYEYYYRLQLNSDSQLDGRLHINNIIAYDKASNAINAGLFIDDSTVRIDNVKPEFDELFPLDSSYVNNSNISYQLSETVESGQSSWIRIDGDDDINSPHVISFNSNQAEGSQIHSLTDPQNLVDGAIYNVTWLAVDTAGNTSNDIYRTEYITYDITAPTAELIYSRYIVSDGYLLKITATFSEPMRGDEFAPEIEIDYQGLNDLAYTVMSEDVNTNNNTVWYIETTIPSEAASSGQAIVSITGFDRAGNQLSNEDISNRDTLLVDNLFPACILEYINISQDWLINEGKAGDQIQLMANFNKPINISLPLLDIRFADSTNASFINKLPDSNTNGDSTYFWSFVLPDNLEDSGFIVATITAFDSAQTPLSKQFTSNDSIFVVDNIAPSIFETGRVNSAGYNNNPLWINAYTDSIEITGSIPQDTSLLLNKKGGIDFQMMNKNRGISGWVTISNMDSPYGDSLQVFGSQKFSRTWDEITNESDSTDGFRPGIDIVHGDTLLFRLKVSDRVGNSTFYDTSTTLLYYDPIPPQIIVLTSGSMVTSTQLVSSDVISAGWSGSLDSTYQGFEGSGIYEYKYKVMEYDIIAPNDTNITRIVDWVSTGTEVSMDTTVSLMPGNLYQLFVTAVDIAGNELDTTSVRSEIIQRINTPPVIGPFTIRTAWEDSLYTGMATATDIDSLTLRGDSLNYFIEWDTSTIFVNGNPVSPIPEIDYPLDASMSIDHITGIVTWVPSPPDTGIYNIRLIVKDSWGLSDTLIYPLTIYPVNDRPYFRSGESWNVKYNLPDLPLPDTSFFEDHDGLFSINLTKYILDEDNNDSSDISWQAVIEDTVSQPGYPRISLIFGPNTPNSIKEELYEKYSKKSDVKSMFLENDVVWKQVPDNLERLAKQSLSLELVQDSLNQTFAYFDSDSNYWADDIKITFIASDMEAMYAIDSILLDVVEVNDRPQWSIIPDQEIYENDTIQFDLGQFVIDVDDTLLTFNSVVTASWELVNGSWVVNTDGNNFSIIPSEYTSTNIGDSITIIPDQLWSGYAFFEIIATDEKNASDTISFRMDVRHLPRPHLTINIIQNNAFTHYFDVIITDTLERAIDVILDIENKRIALDTLDDYTYLGHTRFKDPGAYEIEVYANASVGDTIVFRSVGLVLARTLGRWSGASSDGRFHVDGEAGSVSTDQSIMVVDSTMFKKGFKGSYKLGDEVQQFTDPVKVSLMSYQEDEAIYQRNYDNTWTELPSYYDQGRIVAYTEKMGYFRLGHKTLVVPGLTSLGQNYPNPFNPVTKITYDVGFVDGPEQQVNLSIYNLLGQHVQTLVDGQQTIGRHTVPWYGRDKTGMNVASGVYFMHMTTNTGKIQTKKVMLLR